MSLLHVFMGMDKGLEWVRKQSPRLIYTMFALSVILLSIPAVFTPQSFLLNLGIVGASVGLGVFITSRINGRPVEEVMGVVASVFLVNLFLVFLLFLVDILSGLNLFLKIGSTLISTYYVVGVISLQSARDFKRGLLTLLLWYIIIFHIFMMTM